MEKSISLTDAEWSVMECLWSRAPRTGRELTEDREVRHSLRNTRKRVLRV